MSPIIAARRAPDIFAWRGVTGSVGPTTEAVVWAPATIVNCVVDAPNTLRKNAGGAAWNAGAVSTKAITSGAGYLEFTATEATTRRVAGLSVGNIGSNYTEIDFGFYLVNTGALWYRENGAGAAIGVYVPGDVLRVAVSAAGVVTYLKNGGLLRTSPVAAVWPLLVDTSLFDNAGTIGGATLSGLLGASGF